MDFAYVSLLSKRVDSPCICYIAIHHPGISALKVSMALPLFSGGLHDREIVDLDFVARLGIGGIEGAFLLLGHVGDGENPYIPLGPKNGQKNSPPREQISSPGGYFHCFGMITALEDSSNPRESLWWVG